ncbi:MAG: hypothetical protein HYY68_08835, partial [Thaumarchaeota archaeon]|nr:hypothetical protein [Nitrososphaerota archaeon]
GSIYTIVAASSGSYAFASSGSQTSANWYDAGSSASVSAAETGAISFGSWSGSPTIATPSSLQTTAVMNSYYVITARFNIGP